MEKLTKNRFRKILNNYVAQQQDYIREHEEIKAILKPLEGKEINGRTLNAKVLKGYIFSPEYSMYYIKGKYTHLIGYQNSGYNKGEHIIAIDKTDFSRGYNYFDSCNGDAARERINKVKSIDFDKAFKLFSAIQKHFDALRKLFGDVERFELDSYNFPAYYSVLDAIYKPDNNNREGVKLTDFYFIRK
jgi:hypothetical protein